MTMELLLPICLNEEICLLGLWLKWQFLFNIMFYISQFVKTTISAKTFMNIFGFMTILCTLKWLQDSCVTCIFTGETNWTGYWRPKRQIYLERTAGTVHQGSSFLTSASWRWPRCRICRGCFTMSSTVICRKREE